MDKLSPNIVLIGMPGSGKSTIGRLLSKKFNWSFCDVDKYMEEKYKMEVREIYSQGEEYFREMERKSIEEIIGLKPKIISTGGGVVKSEESMALLKKDRLIIFINRPLEEIINDIDVNRAIFKGDANRIYKLYEERYPLYKEYSDMEINNSGDINLTVCNLTYIIKTYNKYKNGSLEKPC